MIKSGEKLTLPQKESAAELLKERIYATLALLAVLMSIDTAHYTPMKTGLVVVGTVISLWAASLVATQMARRVVFQNDLDLRKERELQLRRHSPMLAALVLPCILIFLSAIHVISLAVAVNISIISALLLLVAWSILAAKPLMVTKIPLVLLIAVELAIGCGVIALKIFIGH